MTWIRRRHGSLGIHRSLIRTGAAILAMIALVAILTLLLGPVTSWAGGTAVRHLTGKDKADAINGVRQTLLQAAAGIAALTVLVFTGLTFTLNRRGQVTDRYVKAIGLLASEKLDERIGGIYALEHIMIESERDHEAVVQVLAAFVREHATIDTLRPSLWIDPPPKARDGQASGESVPATDIQTALTVLGRRPTRNENQRLDLRRSDLRGVHLIGAQLNGANLSGAQLQGADLSWARLKDADLREAQLNGANLIWAQLQGAELSGAQLQGARLFRARLTGATLMRAQFKDADLEKAQLQDTFLGGADLSAATRLTRHQLENAVSNARTKLPPHLTAERDNGPSAESP
jgi:hypothetical protein